jgi:hypothetical protein
MWQAQRPGGPSRKTSRERSGARLVIATLPPRFERFAPAYGLVLFG